MPDNVLTSFTTRESSPQRWLESMCKPSRTNSTQSCLEKLRSDSRDQRVKCRPHGETQFSTASSGKGLVGGKKTPMAHSKIRNDLAVLVSLHG
jgi:hypothetical protein